MIIAKKPEEEFYEEGYGFFLGDIGKFIVKAVPAAVGGFLVTGGSPIGAAIGQRGVRVQTVISELGGEKIDIVEYSEDPKKFIINALSPAKISSVTLNEKEKIAKVKVRPDQLSLVIGKQGQNVKLASSLTGWKIEIEKEQETTKRTKEKKAEEKQSE